ncbi:MAG: hypothetical protein R3330_11580, partial [Saprospiraceae bacterium]|nr:hypothetical protein [Saprospiraceae bacterium]
MKPSRMSLLSLFVVVSLALGSLDSGAQSSAPRYPLLEHFTNTPCSICGSQNPGFFNRLEAYEGQYH